MRVGLFLAWFLKTFWNPNCPGLGNDDLSLAFGGDPGDFSDSGLGFKVTFSDHVNLHHPGIQI